MYIREYVEKVTMYELIEYINKFYKTWRLFSIMYDNINKTYIAILETDM